MRPRISGTTIAVVLGAAAMYFLDPDRGRARRARARDKVTSLTHRAERRLGRAARGAGTRFEGAKGKLRAGAEMPPPNDETLADKIRSEVLRHQRYPGIIVNCEGGVAVLRGVLDDPDAIAALEQEVRKITGVLDVRNLVHTPGWQPVAP